MKLPVVHWLCSRLMFEDDIGALHHMNSIMLTLSVGFIYSSVHPDARQSASRLN